MIKSQTSLFLSNLQSYDQSATSVLPKILTSCVHFVALLRLEEDEEHQRKEEKNNCLYKQALVYFFKKLIFSFGEVLCDSHVELCST